MPKSFYIYILTNKPNGTLYIGVTSNLIKRVFEHKDHLADGFTKQYSIDKLIYFEEHKDIKQAIIREKQIKKWNRSWKIRLIEKLNPNWTDLYTEIVK